MSKKALCFGTSGMLVAMALLVYCCNGIESSIAFLATATAGILIGLALSKETR